jgi:glycosyltransferase involved in cell wall biosynthesis
MKDVFLDLVKREAYDVVIFHGKDNFAVIDGWSERPIVADVCDATTQRLRQGLRYAPLIELPWRTLRYLEARKIERKLLQQTPHQIFISPRDRSYMPGVSPRSRVIPNGIDLPYWTRKTDSPDTPTIVFTGVMSYAPNVDGAIHLLKQTLPRVRQVIPLHQVLIVGRDPSSSLREAARAFSDVRVTGFVDDVRPYLEQAAVFVAPLRYASGMQNKVVEAMAMRVPVVTTSSVAKGLRVEDNGDPPLLLAEGEEETAEQILHLLRNRAARLQLADEGRRYVESHFDWSRSASMLEQVCIEAVSQGPPQEKAGRAQKQTPEAVATERQSVDYGYPSH